MLHLLRHVGAFFDLNMPEKGTSPACWPMVERTVATPIVVLFRVHAHLMQHKLVFTMKKEGAVS